MSRRRNVNKSDYQRLDPSSVGPEQFRRPKRKFPIKQLILVFCFMIGGSACITFSILISAGYYDKKYADRIFPLLLLGILMFIPGGYYGYIFVCILCKREGFTVEDIPIF